MFNHKRMLEKDSRNGKACVFIYKRLLESLSRSPQAFYVSITGECLKLSRDGTSLCGHHKRMPKMLSRCENLKILHKLMHSKHPDPESLRLSHAQATCWCCTFSRWEKLPVRAQASARSLIKSATPAYLRSSISFETFETDAFTLESQILSAKCVGYVTLRMPEQICHLGVLAT